MKLVSFDPLRSLGLPNVTHLNPKDYYSNLMLLENADWLLFPPYALVNTLYYAVNRRVFPSIASYHLGHDKVEMTRAFQSVCPEHVPDTVILPNTPTHQDQLWETRVPPFVAKDPIGSQGRGVYWIESQQDWRAYCERANILYVQEYLPIERDMRLVVVGHRVVAAYWRHLGPDGFHTNVARGGRVQQGDIPPSAIVLVERICTRLGIDHGGFDLAECNGQLYLFEFNRLCGNAGLDGAESTYAEQLLAYLRQKLDTDIPTRRRPPYRRPRRQPRAA